MYYFCGSRLGQILHERLRMQCSSLKQHLYFKNIEPDPYCTCGGVETTEHFLLHCKNYDRLRHKHFEGTCKLRNGKKRKETKRNGKKKKRKENKEKSNEKKRKKTKRKKTKTK